MPVTTDDNNTLSPVLIDFLFRVVDTLLQVFADVAPSLLQFFVESAWNVFWGDLATQRLMSLLLQGEHEHDERYG